ncbi:hypothetical protein HDV06_002430 [Boothiomyces sp. JEL0866]|nr:hypothetical protein HDV06_002430 [Boothiomyces sp. JEL0866]
MSLPQTSYAAVIGILAYLSYRYIVPTDNQFMGSLKQSKKKPVYFNEDYWPEHGYIDLPQGKTHYYLIGPKDGIKVVFVHGLGTPPPALSGFLNQLAENGFRILTYESYGRGYSDSPGTEFNEQLFVNQLALVLLKFGWTNYNIIGYSLGGAVVAGFASRFPENIKKVAFIAPAGIMKKLPAITLLMRLPVIGKLFTHTVGRSILRKVSTSGTVPGFRNEGLDTFRRVQGEHVANNPGFMRAFRSTLIHFPWGGSKPAFEKIEESHKNKILGLWGALDVVVPAQLASELLQIMPSMKLEFKDGVGHELILEDTDYCVKKTPRLPIMLLVFLASSILALATTKPVSVPIQRKIASHDKLENILIGIQHTLGKINQGNIPTFTVNNYNNDNTLYTCTIKVSQQQFVMDIDTGSADTIFRHPNCTSMDNSCNQGTKLNLDDPAIIDLKKRFNINYNNGAFAVGKIYSSALSIGGLVSRIPFGAAIKLSSVNIPGGLLGLAFDKISQISSTTGISANFLDGMGLRNNMFSLYLSNSNDLSLGEIIFGGIDAARIGGNINYYPVANSGFWQFSLNSFTYSVNGASGSANLKINQVIVDSGTSMILLEQSVADSINRIIGGVFDSSKGVYRIPCSALIGPDIIFSIGNDNYKIPASAYVISVPNGCISGISFGADISGNIVFGDMFIRQYYTIFDKTNNRIGFGLAIHS